MRSAQAVSTRSSVCRTGKYPYEKSARLTKFRNLKHLFVLIEGLSEGCLRRARVDEEIKKKLQRLKDAYRVEDWKIPSYTIVEDERELLRIWESWKIE